MSSWSRTKSGWRPSSRSRRALLAATLLAAALPARAAHVLILAEAREQAAALSEELPGAEIGLLGSGGGLTDPIRKGRLLSAIGGAELVVPVGDAALAFLLAESAGSRSFFVGAAHAPGRHLAASRLGGIFAYSAEDLLSVLAARPEARRVGLLYTPGYEPVVRVIRAAAARRGVAIQAVLITRPSALPGSLRALSGRVGALWALGDPALSEGAAFEYLVEFALHERLLLLGASAEEVRRGALLASEADQALLLRAGAVELRRILHEAPTAPYFGTGPAGGSLIGHPALLRRYGIDPVGLPWRVP